MIVLSTRLTPSDNQAVLIVVLINVGMQCFFFEEILRQNSERLSRCEKRKRERKENVMIKHYVDLRREHTKARQLARQMSDRFHLPPTLLVMDSKLEQSESIAAVDERNPKSLTDSRHHRKTTSVDLLPKVQPQFSRTQISEKMKTVDTLPELDQII